MPLPQEGEASYSANTPPSLLGEGVPIAIGRGVEANRIYGNNDAVKKPTDLKERSTCPDRCEVAG